MTGGIPVLQEFYHMLMRHGKASRVMESPWMDGGFKRMAAGMSRTVTAIDPAARVSFWRAFDILPDTQVALEEEYRNMVLEFSAGELDTPIQFYRHVW